VDRFGVGSPNSVKREPSVPPRTIVSFGSRPARRIASSANCSARGSFFSPSAMLRYCFVTATSTAARGNSAVTVFATARSTSARSASRAVSKSRSSTLIFTCATPPSMT
jgi:hypothetical protein